MDIETTPKLLVDEFGSNFNKSVFNLVLRCGQNQSGFCLTAAGAKNLSNALQQQILLYEQKFGEIDMTGVDSGIPSPIGEL